MYKKILVPLDGSKRAERVLPHVEKIAQDNGAMVIFLTVASTPMVFGYDDMQYQHFEVQFERLLGESEKYVKGLSGEFKARGIEARHRIVTGPVVKEILDAAEREDVDLVAICSHGRGGLSRLFYGSVASGILNRVDRPLLIIRARRENGN
ncbi:MAG: universal stress protein [Desulfosarcina sp.]|nr:universal stress protein [Desulfobacterales bacterium]